MLHFLLKSKHQSKDAIGQNAFTGFDMQAERKKYVHHLIAFEALQGN